MAGKEFSRNYLSSEGVNNTGGEYQLQSPYEFLVDFEKCALGSKNLVGIETMEYKADGEVVPRVEAMLTAAIQRGISAVLHVDHYARLYPYRNYSLTNRPVGDEHKTEDLVDTLTLRSFENLQSAGVKVFFSHPPSGIQRLYPQVMGRNHVKMAIADNTAWLGSLNLLDFDFARTNFMVKIRQPAVVDLLAAVFESTEHKTKTDRVFNMGDERVLVDAGVTGTSIIYDEAANMVRNAQGMQPIKLSTQFVPDGELLEALMVKAKTGTPCVVAMSPKDHRFYSQPPYSFLYKIFLHKIRGIPNFQVLHQPTAVHSKLLIVDDQVLFGSHSLTKLFVLLGTRDVAIRSGNPSLKQQCDDFFSKFVNLK